MLAECERCAVHTDCTRYWIRLGSQAVECKLCSDCHLDLHTENVDHWKSKPSSLDIQRSLIKDIGPEKKSRFSFLTFSVAVFIVASALFLSSCSKPQQRTPNDEMPMKCYCLGITCLDGTLSCKYLDGTVNTDSNGTAWVPLCSDIGRQSECKP